MIIAKKNHKEMHECEYTSSTLSNAHLQGYENCIEERKREKEKCVIDKVMPLKEKNGYEI